MASPVSVVPNKDGGRPVAAGGCEVQLVVRGGVGHEGGTVAAK